jgi:hypothetical protein
MSVLAYAGLRPGELRELHVDRGARDLAAAAGRGDDRTGAADRVNPAGTHGVSGAEECVSTGRHAAASAGLLTPTIGGANRHEGADERQDQHDDNRGEPTVHDDVGPSRQAIGAPGAGRPRGESVRGHKQCPFARGVSTRIRVQPHKRTDGDQERNGHDQRQPEPHAGDLAFCAGSVRALIGIESGVVDRRVELNFGGIAEVVAGTEHHVARGQLVLLARFDGSLP